MDVLFAQDKRSSAGDRDPLIVFQRHYLKTLLYKAVMYDEHPTMDELAEAMGLRNSDIYHILNVEIVREPDGLWRMLVSTMHRIRHEGDTGRSTKVERPPTWFMHIITGVPDDMHNRDPHKSVAEAMLLDFFNQRNRFRDDQVQLLTQKATN